MCILSNGTLARRIWWTNKVNITLGHITQRTAVCPYYLHDKNSPVVLPRATRPSTLKGYVGTLKDGYVHNVPLPQVQQEQRASPEQIAPKDRKPLPGYLQLQSWIPTLPKIGSVLVFGQRML